MLLSSVLFLKPLSPAFPHTPLGRAGHSFFLEQVRKTDPALAQALHDESSVKPFTLSDLRRSRGEDSPAPFWLRCTTFEIALSQLWLERALPGLPEQVELGDVKFQIVDFTLDAQRHSWAGQDSYAALAQEHLLGTRRPANTFELLFTSPTTFHVKGDKHQPFPLPELLLGSWLNRWNAFAPLAFPLDTRPYAESSLAVSRYDLQTEALHYGKASFIGFTGRCTFRLLEDDPYWARLVHTLTYYAFYCGTGAKTTQGMGQTRRI